MSHHRSMELIGTRSFRIIIRLDHARPDEGVLVAHGDQGGGYLIYVEDGRLRFAHNHRGKLSVVSTEAVLPEGSLTVTVDVAAPGGWLWDVRLLVDGDDAAPTMQVPMLWGQVPFQGIDIGETAPRRCPGRCAKLTGPLSIAAEFAVSRISRASSPRLAVSSWPRRSQSDGSGDL